MTTTSPKLKVINNHAYANSLDLAKHFHKSHDKVMRTIRETISTLNAANFGDVKAFGQRNFAPNFYKDSKGEARRMFNLSRDAFALIAMGFTGERALLWKVRYITAFNELEAELYRRQMKNFEFGQMKLHFPDAAETIEESLPFMTVSYAVARLTELGLMIPPVSRQQIIRLIKRKTLAGFKDHRQWCIYAESFNRFVKMRRGQFV